MLGLYIHIPFCKQKCLYCDFYSIVQQDSNFFQCIIKELSLYKDYNFTFDTIFFGGGTPSLLHPSQLYKILNFIFKNFMIAPNPEITIETNPESLSLYKLKAYRSMGINRLSLGIQSLNDKILKYIGRLADSQKIFSTIDILHKINFPNINFDLIYGLPYQTTNNFLSDIQTLLSFTPQHFSLYNLILHENGSLALKIHKDNAYIEDGIEMYEKSRNLLSKKGYHHYEISNFAHPSYESRHNLHYWNYDSFLGIGPSATGFIKNTRYQNIASIPIYKKKLQGLTPSTAVQNKEMLDNHTMQNEFIMMNLRKTQGMTLKIFQEQFGQDFLSLFKTEIEELKSHNLVSMNQTHFFLTHKAYFISNSIIEKFFI